MHSHTNAYIFQNGRIKTAGGFKWESSDKNNSNKCENSLTNYKQIKTYPNGKIYNKFTKRFIKSKTKNSNGQYVRLFKKEDDKKRVEHEFLLHRLVAYYFLRKPKDLSFNGVKHIDSDKKNNDVGNLKWIKMPHLKHELNI
jgi:hypothetical protein